MLGIHTFSMEIFQNLNYFGTHDLTVFCLPQFLVDISISFTVKCNNLTLSLMNLSHFLNLIKSSLPKKLVI